MASPSGWGGSWSSMVGRWTTVLPSRDTSGVQLLVPAGPGSHLKGGRFSEDTHPLLHPCRDAPANTAEWVA